MVVVVVVVDTTDSCICIGAVDFAVLDDCISVALLLVVFVAVVVVEWNPSMGCKCCAI